MYGVSELIGDQLSIVNFINWKGNDSKIKIPGIGMFKNRLYIIIKMNVLSLETFKDNTIQKASKSYWLLSLEGKMKPSMAPLT